MLQIKDRPLTTANQAKSILDRHTSQYGLIIDLDRSLDYVSYCVEKNKVLNQEWWEMAGTTSLSYTKTKDVRTILKTRFGVENELLMDKKKEAFNKNVIAKVLESQFVGEGAKEFIRLYQEINSNGYIQSYLAQYVNSPLVEGESFEGHRMVLTKPIWSLLATGRISASKPSLQNLTHTIGDIITYPKGTILLRADSGQIEPRITYSHYIKDPLLKALIIAYNDAYYGMLRFITLTDEEEMIIRFREGFFYEGWSMVLNGKRVTEADGCPVPIRDNITLPIKQDLPDEGRKKIKLYLLAGNYGGNLRGKFPGDPLAEKFERKIKNHPLRLRLQSAIDRDVDRGQEKFYTVFGNEIQPEDTDKYNKKEDPESWMEHLKRCGFNNPIQGTASDLMCESVYFADNLIMKEARGMTFIMYYKHDEGAFIVDEKDSHIIDRLKECTAYQVRDWIPIYADAEIGKKGGTPDWYDLSKIIA